MPAITQGELYVVVRKAVEDAILGVLGTVILVGLAFVLVWFGAMVATSALHTSTVGVLGGVVVIVFGFYIAASALGVVPSVSDLV